MPTKKEVDFLIIGQGIAGSLLAWFLFERRQQIHIIDNNHQGSSSAVAAGIINPVTGRRLVKSWKIDELLPCAKKTYQHLEKVLSTKLYKERTIFRALGDIKAENTWDERSVDNGYQNYLGAKQPSEKVKSIMEPPFSWGSIHQAAQVNIPNLLNAIKSHFLAKSAITNTEFKAEQLVFLDNNSVAYNNIIAKQVIFCEGQRARFNTWFKYLPFVVSKGEMLEIEIPEATDFPIVKHKAYLAPLAENRFWVGATYEWDDLAEEPTEKGKAQLIKNLEKSINSPYTIAKQNAAIRPTVKDRRPFLGTHPEHSQLHIFNGLGTKGTSLGPFWGLHFVSHLLDNNPLDETVDIRRFS